MTRVLFVATYPDQPTGYGRIAHHLVHFLIDAGMEVVYFGISNFPSTKIHRVVDPRIRMVDVLEEEKKRGFPNEVYGVHVIADTIRTEKPDIVFIYNDVIVTCRLLNEILTVFPERCFRLMTYLDIVYPHEKKEYIHHVMANCNDVIFFSDAWRRQITNEWTRSQPNTILFFPRMHVLHHGIDPLTFFPVETAAARQQLGLPLNGFMFLNMNRNTYRKAPDLTIRAFLMFWKWAESNKDVYLVMQCRMESSSGYSILRLVETECALLEFSQEETVKILNHHIISVQSGENGDEMVNLLYNACEVGINTCVGEGFGLTNVEHAWVMRPQIVSAVGSFPEIFGEAPIVPITPIVDLQVCQLLDDHHGVMSIVDPADIARAMKNVFSNYQKYEKKAKEFATNHLFPRFHLNVVREKFLHIISDAK